jgi:hypothetical protein
MSEACSTDASFCSDDEMPFFVATIRLLDENRIPIRDPPDEPTHASAQQKRLLYGSLASSPYSLFDLNRQKGTFFLFPDVSVRLEGKYRLGVSIIRLRCVAVLLWCRLLDV